MAGGIGEARVYVIVEDDPPGTPDDEVMGCVNKDPVYVLMVSDPPGTQGKEVMYVGNMPMWAYLQDVFLPNVFDRDEFNRVFDGSTAAIDCTVDGTKVFTSEDKGKLVFKVLRPGCTILVDPMPTLIGPLRGNAVEWDCKDECCICTEENTNYQILGCRHIFHALCLHKLLQHDPVALCPCCRGRIQDADVDVISRRFNSDVEGGRLTGDGNRIVNLTFEDEPV